MNFSNVNFSSLLYLVVILVILLVLFLLSNRSNLNKNLQNLSIWFLIFFGAVACYYIWTDIRLNILHKQYESQASSNGNLIIQKAPDGHFYLTLELNKIPTTFLVDTGATRTLLSKKDLAYLGQNIKVQPEMTQLETANGSIFAEKVTIEDVKVHDLQLGTLELLVVSKNFEGPKKSLLGMDLLNKFKNFEFSKHLLKIQLK